jgi:signal peptide peptidase SppA
MPDELLANLTEEAPLAFRMLNLNGRPWVMPRCHLHDLAEACGRFDLDAVVARMGQPLDDARGVMNYRGTAVVNIRGPLFRYRSIWTWLLGGTSVEETALALHAAVDDPGVQRIVLAINSPGGQIDGINELANMIRAANGSKPVTAYVDGLAASGGYWLASAAGRIIADETAQLGSIGVLATVMDDRAAEEKHGVKRYEIVSSQSPLKRTDPGTDEGRAQLQQMVDAMASVFISKVAKFRGTSEDKVANEFGRGAVLPAGDALRAGMADALGSLESLIGAGDGEPIRVIRDQPGLRVAARPLAAAANEFDEEELAEDTEAMQLTDDTDCTCPPGEDCTCGEDDNDDESEGTQQVPDGAQGEGEPIMPNEPAAKPPAPAITRQAVIASERQRIAAILNCEEARGREELARVLALETSDSLEAVKKILVAVPVAAKQVNALEAHMAQIPNPKVGIAGEPVTEETNASEVQRILAFVPKARRHAVQ